MTLDELIEAARRHVMTDDERAAQRTSFAYWNLALSKTLTDVESIKEFA